MRPQPLLCVRDVPASARWYAQLLGGTSEHGGSEYGRIHCGGRLVLQLHDFAVDHYHGRIGDPAMPVGNGVLVWFETDDLDAALTRVEALAPEVVRPRHRNPNALHWEIWVRDPDGYTVVIASPEGSA